MSARLVEAHRRLRVARAMGCTCSGVGFQIDGCSCERAKSISAAQYEIDAAATAAIDAPPPLHWEDPLPPPAKLTYTLGKWFTATTIDEMQAFYLHRLPAIREAAREVGYAIGLHGSTRRDFDLMAMQWRDGAADIDTLAHAIANAACGISRDGPYDWEQKPMGRMATSLPICWVAPNIKQISAGHIDLSVIPPQTPPLPVETTAEALRDAPLSIRIRHERAGRAFWHVGCGPEGRGESPMRQVKHLPSGTIFECAKCGAAGVYPVGGVGEEWCPHTDAVEQAGG